MSPRKSGPRGRPLRHVSQSTHGPRRGPRSRGDSPFAEESLRSRTRIRSSRRNSVRASSLFCPNTGSALRRSSRAARRPCRHRCPLRQRLRDVASVVGGQPIHPVEYPGDQAPVLASRERREEGACNLHPNLEGRGRVASRRRVARRAEPPSFPVGRFRPRRRGRCERQDAEESRRRTESLRRLRGSERNSRLPLARTFFAGNIDGCSSEALRPMSFKRPTRARADSFVMPRAA